MDSKQIIGILLVILGIVGLGYGIFNLTSGNVGTGPVWAAAILGLMFFFAGISLMKSVKSTAE